MNLIGGGNIGPLMMNDARSRQRRDSAGEKSRSLTIANLARPRGDQRGGSRAERNPNAKFARFGASLERASKP